MNRPLLICDLDGTLVDSFPGIAAALQRACDRTGIEPAVTIDRSLIGPPLEVVLRKVVGDSPDRSLGAFRDVFLESYDGGMCCLAPPFDGIEEMLPAILRAGHRLALATNKRLAPTRKILHALGWTALFRNLETVDSRPDRTQSKTTMLRILLGDRGGSAPAALYLGDSVADVQAAHAAGIPCALASWGYESAAAPSADYFVTRPHEVQAVLAQLVSSA